MTAASPNVVSKAPGMWVFEHLAALGVDEEALEYAAPLLGNDQQVVDASARLAARLALLSVTRALQDDEDIEIDITHCKLLRAMRDALLASGESPEQLEQTLKLNPLFAAVVIRADDWDQYKKTLDAFFPPGSSGEKGPASPVSSPSKAVSMRPELLATFSRCRSGADEGFLNAQREKHGMHGSDMRAAAWKACAVARKKLGGDSLDRIAGDFNNGSYEPSRGAIPALSSFGAETFRFAKSKGKVSSARKTNPVSPKRKSMLTPKKGLPDKRVTRGSGAANTRTTRQQEANAFEELSEPARDPHDVFDFANEREADRRANRAFEALGAAAEAMEAAEEMEGGLGSDIDAEPHTNQVDLTSNRTAGSPVQRVMGAMGWRRGGGGAGDDRNGSDSEDDDENDDEDIEPTQAAPDSENRGILRRVGGLFGLGKSSVKGKRADDSDDEISTSKKKKKKAPKPLGIANRHSKRAINFANVPSLPRKKRVRWTEEETHALEQGVQSLIDCNDFNLGKNYTESGGVNDKWRRIYDAHRDVFDVNGRTTMDLKDKWRNIVKARTDAIEGVGEDGDGSEGGASSPTSWGRAMIRLGLARAPVSTTPGGSLVPLPRRNLPPVPKEPGVSNRHSALRKKLGLSSGLRKKAAKWSDEEVEALKDGVDTQGEGKWAAILKANPQMFIDRSAVDLKDKWRNLKGRATRGHQGQPRRVNGEDFIGVPQRNDGFVDVKKKENDEDSDSDEAFKIKTAKVDTEDIVSDSE